MLDTIGIILSATIPNFILGILLALPVLIPPLRRLSRRSARARRITILVFGLLSLIISFAVWTRSIAELIYAFNRPFLSSNTLEFTEHTEYRENRRAIVNEIWMRRVVPPPWRRSCYTSQETVCHLADYVAPAAEMDDSSYQTGYLHILGVNLISALTTGAFVWLFTRQRRPATHARSGT
jgi:hypothetical protein